MQARLYNASTALQLECSRSFCCLFLLVRAQNSVLLLMWPLSRKGLSPFYPDVTVEWTVTDGVPVDMLNTIVVGHARNACTPGSAEPPPTGDPYDTQVPQPGEDFYKREHYVWQQETVVGYYQRMLKVSVQTASICTSHVHCGAVYRCCSHANMLSCLRCVFQAHAQLVQVQGFEASVRAAASGALRDSSA